MNYINIQPIDIDIDDFGQIEFIKYNLNDDSREFYGYTVQNLQTTVPDASVIPINPNQKFGSNFQQLYSLAIKSQQTLKLRADLNTIVIKPLEERINDIISRIHDIQSWYAFLYLFPLNPDPIDYSAILLALFGPLALNLTGGYTLLHLANAAKIYFAILDGDVEIDDLDDIFDSLDLFEILKAATGIGTLLAPSDGLIVPLWLFNTCDPPLEDLDTNIIIWQPDPDITLNNPLQFNKDTDELLKVNTKIFNNDIRFRASIWTKDGSRVRLHAEVRNVFKNFENDEEYTGDFMDSPGTIFVDADNLNRCKDYHWQIIAESENGDFSEWQVFSTNIESERDFRILATTDVFDIKQFESNGIVEIPVGGGTIEFEDEIIFIRGTVFNVLGQDVRLEVETRDVKQLFINSPTSTGDFFNSGEIAEVEEDDLMLPIIKVPGSSFYRKFQIRARSTSGDVSDWKQVSERGGLESHFIINFPAVF